MNLQQYFPEILVGVVSSLIATGVVFIVRKYTKPILKVIVVIASIIVVSVLIYFFYAELIDFVVSGIVAILIFPVLIILIDINDWLEKQFKK